jgi:hypothetical protein
MHARYDGVIAATFAKPSSARPVVVASLGVFDGCELTVYAETRNNGDNVYADVFVNRTSLSTGEPMAAVGARATDAVSASTEDRRVGCLSQASSSIWLVPILLVFSGLRNVRGPNAPLALVIAFAGGCLVTWLGSTLMARALKVKAMTRNRGIGVAAVAYSIALAGSIAALMLGIVIAGAR